MGALRRTSTASRDGSVRVLREASPEAVRNALVTVGIPAYNADQFLLETLRTMTSQTMDRIVIHVHDDGSTDNTAAVALSVGDPRLMVTQGMNRGIGGAANVLTSFASTPYFARADADDLHLAHRLAVQLDYLDSHALDIMSAQVAPFDATKIPDLIGADMDPDRVNVELLLYNPLPNPLAFGRTEVFRAIPYSTSTAYGEDYEFWCDAASAGLRNGLTAQPLARYRRHPSAASSRLAGVADLEVRAIRRRYHEFVFPGEEPARFRDWLAWIIDLRGPMSADQTATSLRWAFRDIRSVGMVNLDRPLVEEKLAWLVARRFIDQPSATSLGGIPRVLRHLGLRAALLGLKRGWSRRDFWL